jgi:hypothetical protein
MGVIIHSCAQRSDEWYSLRSGRLTGSRAADMLAQIKKGEAAARRDLRLTLVCERLTGQCQDDPYVSREMRRGIEREAFARAAYEARTGRLVQSCGFMSHETLMAGFSPDGVIGSMEGLLEVKVPKSATHLKYRRARGIPQEYWGQVVHGLWISGAQWLDFVSFDDRFPAAMQLLIIRVKRDEEAIAAYAKEAVLFLGEVDAEEAALRAEQ